MAYARLEALLFFHPFDAANSALSRTDFHKFRHGDINDVIVRICFAIRTYSYQAMYLCIQESGLTAQIQHMNIHFIDIVARKQYIL